MNRSFCYVLCFIAPLLCFGFVVRAITISGPTTVCVGNSGTYSVSPTSGNTYSWTTDIHGNVVSTASSSAVVTWGAVGTGTVYVYGVNGHGDTVETGSLSVTVASLPNFYLTSNSAVGCQQLVGDSVDGVHYPIHILSDTSGCINVCAHSTVTYTANDPVPGGTFTWVVSGATSYSSAGDSCTVNWGNVGPGEITAYETNANGCKDSVSICFNIIARPHAIFYTLPDSSYNTDATSLSINACLKGNIEFTSISTGTMTSPIVSEYWNFGDGTILTSGSNTTLTHRYFTPGTYTVTLVVTNACNCRDTAKLRIVVSPLLGLDIECPGVVCDSSTGTYAVNTTIPCTPYQWSTRGGTIVSTYDSSVTIYWDNVDTSGFGAVIFNDSFCTVACPGETIMSVPVIQRHGHISGPGVVCTGGQYIYRLPQWPTTDFSWSISGTTGAWLRTTDQWNEIVLNTVSTGTIVLTCIYNNTLLYCGGTAIDTITIDSTLNIIGSTSLCFGDTAGFSLPSGLSGNWTLTKPVGSQTLSGSNTFNPVINQVGHYVLTVTGAFCAASISFSIDSLPPAPDSLLGPDTACPGIPIFYQAKNPIPGTCFEWAVTSGGGSCSGITGNSTYATFTGTGPWTLKVWRVSMTSPYCMSLADSIVVHPPHISLTISGPDTVCSGTSHNYSVNYLGGETYEWGITPSGRGSVTSGSTTPNITALWNSVVSPGQTAKLWVKVRKCTLFYTDTISVYIRAIPTLTVTANKDTICSGQPVTFTVTGSSSLTPYDSAWWNWGDGSPVVTLHNPASFSPYSHTYTISGSSVTGFVANVTVSDPNGCVVRVSGASPTVWVKPVPVAFISPTSPLFAPCDSESFYDNMTATVTSGFGYTANFAWYFNGTFLNSGPSDYNHSDNRAGTYYCVVTNSNGCSDTAFKTVLPCDSEFTCHDTTPSMAPVISLYDIYTTCGHVHIAATWTGTGFGETWTYPPGAINPVSTDTSFDADYLTAGNYTFTFYLNYITHYGDTCTTQASTNFIVPYRAGLLYNVTCDPSDTAFDVTLLDNSNYFPTTHPAYAMYIDGTLVGTSTIAYATLSPGYHTFSETLSYLLYPTCSDTAYFLGELPQASFHLAGIVPAQYCVDDVAVSFVNTSTPLFDSLSVLWDFYDGTFNTSYNASRVYNTPGIYYPSLTVTDPYGCTSMASDTINIVANNLSGFDSISPQNPCQGEIVTLAYVPLPSTESPVSYVWFQQTSPFDTTTDSSIYIYQSGAYWTHVSDNYGCYINTGEKSVTFVAVPPAIITGDTSACVFEDFTLDGYAGPGVSYYTWYRDGSWVQTASASPLGQMFTMPGVHTYQLVISVTNGSGYCSDTSATFTVTVHGLPAAPIVTDTAINCGTYKIQLTASSASSGYYNWSNGMHGSTIDVNQGGPYRVWITDSFGCVDSGDFYLPKDPRVYLWVFPTGCYSLCWEDTPYTILGPIANDTFVTWAWLLNDTGYQSGMNSIVPNLSLNQPGPYNLSLGNGLCTDTSSFMDVAMNYCGCGIYYIRIDSVEYGGGVPCVDTIYFAIINTSGGPTSWNMYAVSHGTIPPTYGTIPASPTITYVQVPFTPDPTFVSGWVVFSAYFEDSTGTCPQTDSVYMYGCPGEPKMLRLQTGNVSPESPLLNLVPNPAANTTRVDYQFAGNSSNREIDLYDMLGKTEFRQAVPGVGSLLLDLQSYSPGMYIVLMKQDGTTVAQSKLVIVR